MQGRREGPAYGSCAYEEAVGANNTRWFRAKKVSIRELPGAISNGAMD